jgi:signal recognition particle GTPase
MQERSNPQLLVSSPSRRRRIAEGCGRSEADVAELMAAFAQMKAQASNMGKLMKLSQGVCACCARAYGGAWHVSLPIKPCFAPC